MMNPSEIRRELERVSADLMFVTTKVENIEYWVAVSEGKELWRLLNLMKTAKADLEWLIPEFEERYREVRESNPSSSL